MSNTSDTDTRAFQPRDLGDPTHTVGAEFGAPPDVAPPAAVPGFRLERELGRGGMGVVYLATQDGLNRQVALKMVLSGEHASATDKGRFLAEAEAVAAVRHPGVVQVFDFGTHDGRPYFALEYLPGGSLTAKLNGTPLPPLEAAKLVEGIARAVQAAHDAGVIHRDLKPANILFDADGQPKVTDFGLARKGDASLTATGAVLGTPSYMAPEQAQGRKDVGPPADVYAVGAVLYECLTGRPPFRAASALETVLQVMHDEPLPPSKFTPKLPRDLETVCLKCLSKDPRKRYPSAAAAADDLLRFQTGEPTRARPVSAVERGWRWVKRNPLAAAVVVGGPVLLAGTTLVVLVALLMTVAANVRLATERQNAENRRVEAEEQRALANTRLQKAIEAIDRMMTRVNGERWATDPSLQDERRQAMEDAVAFFNGFTAEDSADPRLRWETAKAYTRVAGAYLMLSDLGRASAAHREAARLYAGLLAEFPDDPEYMAAASEVDSLAGGAHSLSAEYADAFVAYTRAVELADAACGRQPGSHRFKLRAVEARSSLAFFYLQSDRMKGEEVVGPMLRLAREIGDEPNAPFEYRVALAYALTVAGVYDQNAPRVPVAESMAVAADKYDEAKAVIDGLAGQTAPSARAWDQLAHGRALLTVHRGFLASMRAVTPEQRRAAVEQLETGLKFYDALLRVNPKAFPYRLQKYQVLRALVGIYQMLGDTAASANANADADRLITAMRGDNPHLEWLRGMDALRLTAVLIERVRTDQAFAFESEAETLIETANQGNKWDVMYNVACVYAVAAGVRPGDADKHAARAVALLHDLSNTYYFRVPRRVTHLDKDTDLDPLRGRDDFKAFLAAVRKPPADSLRPK